MHVPWAKTAVPHLPPRYIRRPRLLAMLDRAEPGQLVLVSAPAGYGKTLLLADWAAQRPECVAWVSLDDDDGTEHRFWSAVLAALAGCAAVPEGSALNRLTAPARAEAVSGFLVALGAALEVLPVRFDLVLDDVHELREPAPVRALAALVRERPSALRLVLSSRTDPRVQIARMRLAGELCEVRAHDLAFLTLEADALLAGAEVAVTPEQVRQLVAQTEGWAAGLRFAALSLRETRDTERFLADLVGNSKAMSDYLVGEILSGLPADTCDLLRAVSICDQLAAGLAAAVSGRPDAGEVLAALEQETSLVLTVGEGRVSYRIHPLLRAHLRADLQRRRPELVGRLHGRAADWFASHDRMVPALLHARQAGDTTRVQTLIARHTGSLVAMGEHAAVRDALRFLAERGADSDPLIALAAALLAVETEAAADVDRHLARAEASWPSIPSPALVALRMIVRSRAASMAGEPAEVARAVAELDAVEPRSAPDLIAMGQLDLAHAHVSDDRLDEARRLAEAVLTDARRQGRAYLAARSLIVLATVAAGKGDYGQMATLADLASDELVRGGWDATAVAGLTSIVRAYGALLDARPIRCLDLLGPPSRDDPVTDALDPMRHALRAAALVDIGRVEEAVPELRLAQTGITVRPVLVRMLAPVALLVHETATSAGCHDIAAEVQRRAEDVLGPAGDVLLMRARRGASDRKAPRSTAAELRPVLDGGLGVVVPWAIIEAHVLACDLALQANRRPQARRELDQALAGAARSGALRPLLAAGPAVVDLLARQIGSFGAGDTVAARVLELRRAPPRTGVVFTKRERDVLALLSTPRSLTEIAAELDIAPSTVKTHTRAIYTKLGVTSRREAVAAGRRRKAPPARC